MHEASLVQGLLKLALSALNDYNAANPDKRAGRILEIKCGAGLLACFEANTLSACFQIFAENTLAEGAKLTVETLPLATHCDACGNDFELTKRHFVCPQCGSDDLSFTGGNGLVLQAINVDCEENDNE